MHPRYEYHREYRLAHHKKQVSAQRSFRKARREFLARYKAEQGCEDCGVRNPVVLEFHHHTMRRARTGTISTMKNIAMERLVREIAKCAVLCANCHKIRHAGHNPR